MTPQELIKKQIQQEKYNIQTIIDSGMSSGEKLVLLHDLLKWNVVEILNQEIERERKLLDKIIKKKERITNDPFHPARCQYLGQQEAKQDTIAHLTSLKEQIK